MTNVFSPKFISEYLLSMTKEKQKNLEKKGQCSHVSYSEGHVIWDTAGQLKTQHRTDKLQKTTQRHHG